MMQNFPVAAASGCSEKTSNFSDTKFCSDMWIKLKTHILQSNSEADSQTHYVCQYCRPILNKNSMPCRCILNGLVTEPVPKELQVLDPLSKQFIQRGKAGHLHRQGSPLQYPQGMQGNNVLLAFAP